MVLKALRNLRLRATTPLYWLTYHLVIAPQPSGQDWLSIYEAGVRSVVDLRSQTHDDVDTIRSLGMSFRHVPMVDGEALDQASLLQLADWVLEQQAAHGPVLIHCREGRGRSAMAACAVLVRMGIPLAEAYRSIRGARGSESVNLSDEQVQALETFGRLCNAYPSWQRKRGA